MIRIALILGTALAISACSTGLEKVTSLEVEIVEYGIYSSLTIDKAKVTEYAFTTTDNVPFETGTEYGLRFKVIGEPEGALAQIKLQWAVTPGSVTNKRKLARLQQPRLREIATGDYGLMFVTIGQQSLRRPYKNLFFITDMNGRVLARKEFTIVDPE